MTHALAKAALIAGLIAPVCGCTAWDKVMGEAPPAVVAQTAPADPFAAERPVTASIGVAMPAAKEFQHPWDVSTYIMRVTQFSHLPPLNGGIAFVGDSLTDWARWNEMFPDQRVRNFGIAGDTTVGLQHRLDQVIDAKPAKIFLMIGTNDVEFGRYTPEEIVAHIEDMLERLKASLPAAKIYVESLLPRQPEWDAKVRAVNALLKPVAEKNATAYIDLYPLFAKDGRLDPRYTVDDIHMAGEGYVRWCNAIRPYIGSN